jgi:hypothetical protein
MSLKHSFGPFALPEVVPLTIKGGIVGRESVLVFEKEWMSELWFSVETRVIPRVEWDDVDTRVVSCGDKLERRDNDVTVKTTAEEIVQFLET